SAFVRGCVDSDGTAICAVLASRGEFYLPVETYVKIRDITISHNLNLVPLPTENNRPLKTIHDGLRANPAPRGSKADTAILNCLSSSVKPNGKIVFSNVPCERK